MISSRQSAVSNQQSVIFCCDERRRDTIRAQTLPSLNGIDFLEVSSDQTSLLVHLLNSCGSPQNLGVVNVVIEGGERITNILASAVGWDDTTNILTVTVSSPGDFSPYTLRLVTGADNPAPPEDFDPVLSSVQFSFKVGCPSDFDCKSAQVCPASPPTQTEINYLAKDYASFRQLMLDRMSLLMPQWRERHAADLGIALVELLAYVGDQLSYQQDVIATEAHLGTARRRVSVRRHARLVDYHMHDGCNARVWVQVQVRESISLPGPNWKSFPVTPGTMFLTQTQISGYVIPSAKASEAINSGTTIFETMSDLVAYPANNEMNFYTWGDSRCCLPKGATGATLCDGDSDDKRLLLCAGDVLVLEERLGPRTGQLADADPAHRHAVSLTSVNPEATINQDGTRTPGTSVNDPLTGTPIVEIAWSTDDALPFPLCISSMTDEEHGSLPLDNVSVASGNIVLADHGQTISGEVLDAVPEPSIYRPTASDADACSIQEPVPVPPRFNPSLQEAPVTFAAPPPAIGDSAAATTNFSPDEASAAVLLTSTLDGLPSGPWISVQDLLSNDVSPDALAFVVETESDGSASLRFGDDVNGQRPDSGTQFQADYRVGNGTAGNVGALTILQIVGNGVFDHYIIGVRNPLPATGGVEPESIEHVRQSAPYAFRTQERAVTAADYAAKAEQYPGVLRAAATFRWTGSWYTVFLTIDRQGGQLVDDAFREGLLDFMNQYRMAGYDLEIDAPRYVSLEIEMEVCVAPDHFCSDVAQALLLRLSNRMLPCGQPGLFYPDNFTFGQSVYLSQIYAAAQGVDGVAWARVTTFQEQGKLETSALGSGVLKLNRLEIARLDNDPNYSEHGVLRLKMMGGK